MEEVGEGDSDGYGIIDGLSKKGGEYEVKKFVEKGGEGTGG